MPLAYDGHRRVLVEEVRTPDGFRVRFPHLCPWQATGYCALCAWVARTDRERKERAR